jgi:hypothetical protein
MKGVGTLKATPVLLPPPIPQRRAHFSSTMAPTFVQRDLTLPTNMVGSNPHKLEDSVKADIGFVLGELCLGIRHKHDSPSS